MLLPFNLKEFTMNRTTLSLRTVAAAAALTLAAWTTQAQEANSWDLPPVDKTVVLQPTTPGNLQGDQMHTPAAVGAPQWADFGEATIFEDMPYHGEPHSQMSRDEVLAERDLAVERGLIASGEAGATADVLERRALYNELQTIEHEARLAAIEADRQASADQVIMTEDLVMEVSQLQPSGYYVITATDTGRMEMRPYSFDERDVYIERGAADGSANGPTYLR